MTSLTKVCKLYIWYLYRYSYYYIWKSVCSI